MPLISRGFGRRRAFPYTLMLKPGLVIYSVYNNPGGA